jgi:hypothetical protein
MFKITCVRAGKWLFILGIMAVTLSACGRGRKKYLDTIMPLVERNDMIDSQVAKLPRINAYKDPDYLTKLDGYIATKKALLNQMEAEEPPFLMATTHSRLLIAMKNGIRYLESEREKFTIAAQKMEQTAPLQGSIHGSMEEDIIKQYQSQTAAYQANMKEQLMKQQYEKLYGEVKDELERASKM